MTKLAPVLSIDWLQLNLVTPSNLDVKYHSFYTVKKLDFSTRHFRIVEEIFQHDKRIATVTRAPLSNIIAPDTILVKFDNWLLYSVDLHYFISQFIALNNFTFKSISRIDICGDFQRFHNNMLPSTFIKNYLHGQYLRLGRTSISNAHFRQVDTELSFNALKFGSNLSDTSVYLYNKTLEMNSVKWKPWIAEKWLKAGFSVDADTWRLEVSIKSSNKIVCNTDTGEMNILNSLDVLKNNYTKLFYSTFREKYFSFVIKDSQVKKSRMLALPLFSGSFSQYKLIEGDKMLAANRADKIFIKKLESVNNELRASNFNFNIDISKLKEDFIAVTGLTEWAVNRGLL
jgi:hypothetical protein